MHRLIVSLGLAAGLLSVIVTAQAATPPPEEAGRVAATEWLTLVDAGKYPESWDKMDAGFKKEISKRKWASAIAGIRKPLGPIVSRTFKSAQYSRELPGAPEGEYVVVQFDTAFGQKKGATEKVTLMLGQDLVWRVSSYAVK